MDFKDKVVIVTGGSSGIGAETAIQFANQSAKIVIVGRNEENLKKVGKQCQDAKCIQPPVIKADITVDSEVKKIVGDTVKHFGRIDILVNNADILKESKIQDGIEISDKLMNTK